MKKIIFDVMSGESGHGQAINAAIKFADLHPKSQLILVGSKEAFSQRNQYPANIEFIYSTDVVKMDDTSPLTFKRKKDSSLSIAINKATNDPEIKAILSCANTGAYTTAAYLMFKPIKKSIRPALAGIIPVENQNIKTLLDLGAVIDADANALVQFAIMGTIYHKIITGVENPRVSLMANGTEAHKGNAVTKEAFKLLEVEKKINFVGNEEADTVLLNNSDVVVFDGFVGNVALKAFGGTLKSVGQSIKTSFTKNIFRKISSLFAYRALKETRESLTQVQNVGGAVMLGLNKITIKTPGSSKELAMF